MTTTAPTTTVTKVGKFFVTEGVRAVLSARIVNEPFQIAHRTRKAAEAHAREMDRINADGLAYVAERNVARAEDVRAYLTARAARAAADAAQLTLF